MNDTSITRKIVALLLFVMAFAGCETVDPKSDELEVPAVIPEEAFSINLDVFEREVPAGKHGKAYTNWLSAVLRTGTAVYIGHAILHVPFSLTAAVQQVPPVYQGGAFVWAADTLIDGQEHAVQLKAQLAETYIDWQMQVTGVIDETGVTFENFLLYRARTQTDVNEGTFQVYFPVETGSQQVMDGSYEVIDEMDHTLTFSIPQDVDDIGGSSAVFDRDGLFVTLDLIGPLGGTHLIKWNTETGEGSLIAPDYNNGEEACWDETLRNVPCESEIAG